MHLCKALIHAGHDVIAYTRADYGDIAQRSQWDMLSNCDAVVHLAGRAHQTNRHAASDSEAFTRDNVTATEILLNACETHKIKRFIFMSSIAVLGYDSGSQELRADASPKPYNPYSISKAEAEQLVQHSPLDWTIIRIPLVYGEGVKANFHTLLRMVQRQWPLPFGLVNNQRSLVYVGNVCDAINHILRTDYAIRHIVHIADAEPLSVAELIKKIASALKIKTRLLPVPPIMLRYAASIVGKKMAYHKSCGNLVMETASTNRLLNWHPPFSTDDGLRLTVQSITQRT